MSKDKKKKHKGKKAGADTAMSSVVSGKTIKRTKKAVKKVKAIAQNPLVADVVAAALVGMAAALKDSEKGRKMAGDAKDQLESLAGKKAGKGNVMWDFALDIGRKTLETLAQEGSGKAKSSKK